MECIACGRLVNRREWSAARGAPSLSLGRVGAVTVANVEMTSANFAPREARTVSFLNLSGLSAALRPIDTDASGWPRGLDIAADLGGRESHDTVAGQTRAVPSRRVLKLGTAQGQGTFSVSLDTLRATGSVKIARFDPLVPHVCGCRPRTQCGPAQDHRKQQREQTCQRQTPSAAKPNAL